MLLKDKRIKYSIFGLLALVVAFGAGRLSRPSKVVTQYRDKEIIVYKEKKQEKKDVVTTRRRTTSPDGSVTETETTTDRSTTNTSSENTSSRETSLNKTVSNTSGLQLSALVLAQDINLNEYEFGIAVSKRVLGNISLGVIATEKRQIGLTIGMEF